MQALWVQTSLEDCSPVSVGLTKTRLALAYGRKGEPQKAVSLLETAIQDYQKGGLNEDDELLVKATKALQAFRDAPIRRSHRSTNRRRISQGAA